MTTVPLDLSSAVLLISQNSSLFLLSPEIPHPQFYPTTHPYLISLLLLPNNLPPSLPPPTPLHQPPSNLHQAILLLLPLPLPFPLPHQSTT